MLTIAKDAQAMITEKGDSIFLDMPKTITSCCFDYQECPTVRFGEPHDPARYDVKTINGVTVYVPHRLPNDPLEIGISSFLGIKRLVLRGWKVL